MRFGVLGPLAVWTEGGDLVAIRESRVRALLADLLAHDGGPLSPDRLIDDLWGERLPAHPAGALQLKVSRLRNALERAEQGGRRLLEYGPAGYRLLADPEAFDAHRFRRLVLRARQAGGDPAQAASLFAQALALWRGPALADFADASFAQPAIARLEEERLTAMEEHAHVRLALGEHGSLAAELGDLVSRHPLRERLRAAHMRALYLSGRQSEALAAYAGLRARLSDDLGLDPGPELTALHEAILRQDPLLHAAVVSRDTAVLQERPRTNLPAPVDDLIGRSDALRETRDLMASTRLVTLTGPGGVGKTRLAVETARQAAEEFADGAWLVELAGVSPAASAATLAEVTAAALGVRDVRVPGFGGREVPAASAVGALADALRGRRALLVLDNCEHVIDAAAELVERLLATAPGLRLLATSREPLAIAGEHLTVVPPLELPDARSGFDDLRRAAAVELFVARARAAAPEFVLEPGDAEVVAAVCRRLDGLPLALELAAARVRTLGIMELARRLGAWDPEWAEQAGGRFSVLTAGRRGAPARQRTLRAVIDWSWALLSEPERAVLRRLSVHADGCGLRAAEAVSASPGWEAAEVAEIVGRLVDRSLVAVGPGPRYRLLESIAAYAAERLDEAGERDRVHLLHAHHYVELAEQAESRLRGHEQGQWLRRLDSEAANLRVALERAVRLHATGLALRLVNALAWYWVLRGRLGEGRRAFAAALALPAPGPPHGDDSLERAHTVALAWQAAFELLVEGVRRPLGPVLDLLDGLDDPRAAARARLFLGSTLFAGTGMSDSEHLVARALRECTELGDRWGVAAALSARATQAMLRGDLAALRRDGERSHALFEELGDQWGRLQAIDSLTTAAEIEGDYPRAGRLNSEGLRIAEELGLWTEVSQRLSGLGRIALLTGDHEAAERLHTQALRLATEQSSMPAVQFAEFGLALGARRQGRLDVAEAHARRVLAANQAIGYQPGIALTLAELGFVHELRGQADAALAVHLEGHAAARETRDVRALALALEGLAGAHALAGRHRLAAELLGTAAQARRSVSAPLPPGERGDVDRITRTVRLALGERACTAAFERGARRRPDVLPEAATRPV
ncbi:BTAD domain-containing putative transcriptional regulator [Nonomuraea dietziae]|uniref:Putative ATPase/DNA-binding SARP family transcriptional activator n=1 Tax=Nonomuraea dietziae TaxID=65515 RepID=A0A7W5UZP2_9ACTN|nr:BTAD domain-containing putative transcriptional regulator [Nonomuraea dietziae]MBB3726014.1 putative ATPase/DNA-binding SARP family transcriptional activator [Nonomuraea dietziae]